MRQLVAALLHLGGRPLEGRGHRRRRELHAGNASRGQDLPLILSELAHAPLDHLAKVFRNADLDLLQHRVQLPPSVAYDAEPARDKVLDEAHHEQGIALGSPVDDARELRWKRVAREALTQVVASLSGSSESSWEHPRVCSSSLPCSRGCWLPITSTGRQGPIRSSRAGPRRPASSETT